MKELAFRLHISRPLLNYYVYGIKRNKQIIGGRFKGLINIRNEGNNRFIYLKKSCSIIQDSRINYSARANKELESP